MTMPDLLTHALLAYTIARALSLHYQWLDGSDVTVGMAGAFIPDIAKIMLVVPGDHVGAILGMPFSWIGIHTLGGTLVGVLVGSALAAPADRRRATALLALGASSHLVADALLHKAAGHSYPLLWPLSTYAPPTPGLYHSADLWTIPAAGAAALLVTLLERRTTGG
jgi:membrane-bound metal-dependent hydrolase YbcI (DUF457 family)